MAQGDVLAPRALNRATLHRQRLLERSGGVLDTIEHLVGMQGQNPHDPYYALWARIRGFRAGELSKLLAGRAVVRAALMRGTIHLVSAHDYRSMRPIFHSVLTRVLGSTTFARDTREPDPETLLFVAREVIAEQPRTRAELARLLEERWPSVPGSSLAQVATYLLPLVQIPPRGLWGESGAARWALAESWLGSPLDPPQEPDGIILRYLGAFGPASVADMRMWSGLAGLRDVVDRLRPQLRTWRDEAGNQLFDLPEAEHPGPDVPAPPRFLPEFDNVLLGHADRSRFLTGPVPEGRAGNLLVDGFYVGSWKLGRSNTSKGLKITLRVKPTKAQHAQIEEEGRRLVRETGGEAEARVEIGTELASKLSSRTTRSPSDRR